MPVALDQSGDNIKVMGAGELPEVVRRWAWDWFGAIDITFSKPEVSQGLRQHHQIGLLFGSIGDERREKPAIAFRRLAIGRTKMDRCVTHRAARGCSYRIEGNRTPADSRIGCPLQVQLNKGMRRFL